MFKRRYSIFADSADVVVSSDYKEIHQFEGVSYKTKGTCF